MYVGITRHPAKRWKRHQSQSLKNKKYPIHQALAKYGVNNFTFKVVEEFNSWEDACQAEINWIAELILNRYQLYNQTAGGEGQIGRPCSTAQKLKLSHLHAGPGNPMYGKRLYGAANGNFGNKMKAHVKAALLSCRRKLTDQQIDQIRQLYATGNYSLSQLSRQFGVSSTQIHRIVKNKQWQ